MASFGDLLGGGGVFEQLFVWDVFGQVIQALLDPFLTDLRKQINALDPQVPLAPADIVTAELRGRIQHTDAQGKARLSGVAPAEYDLLFESSGEPPGLELVLEAYRRGYVPIDDIPGKPSVIEAIRTSRIVTDTWAETITKMGLVPIGAADAVDAVVEGQIPYDQGQQIAYENGIDADNFRILVNTRGNPPSPADLISMWQRGFIPMQGTGPDALSVQQGIYEGATKDKWEPVYEKFAVRIPPPRTITALQTAGVLDEQTAQSLYQQNGLDAQTAAAYSQSAVAVKLSTERAIIKAQVVALYELNGIAESDAIAVLEPLGYTADEAKFILETAIYNRELSQLNAAITRVRTLYVAHKLSNTDAVNALGALGMPAAQVSTMLTTWGLERAASVTLLTATQIADAFKYNIIDQDTALAKLEERGYLPYDAWLFLSVHMHAALPNPPQETVGIVGPQLIG